MRQYLFSLYGGFMVDIIQCDAAAIRDSVNGGDLQRRG